VLQENNIFRNNEKNAQKSYKMLIKVSKNAVFAPEKMNFDKTAFEKKQNCQRRFCRGK